MEDGPVRVSQKSIDFTPHTWQPYGRVDEIPDINFFCSLVRAAGDDAVILDIGAQTGLYTLGARFYPTTRYHAFEPLPKSAELLKENLVLNNINNAVVYNMGLGDRIGTTQLKVPAHKGLCTMGNDPKRFKDHEVVDVEVSTIDELFGDSRVDVIKIDTEGWEYYILKGGAETIKRCKPKILMEWNETNMEQCGVTIDMMENLMEELNYRPRILYQENVYIIPNDTDKASNDSPDNSNSGPAAGSSGN